MAFAAARLRAAHIFRMRSACAFRCAAVKVRPRFFGAGADAVVAAAFLGGRPRRFVGPWRTSMALLSLSRSAMRRATIWSVGIEEIVT